MQPVKTLILAAGQGYEHPHFSEHLFAARLGFLGIDEAWDEVFDFMIVPVGVEHVHQRANDVRRLAIALDAVLADEGIELAQSEAPEHLFGDAELYDCDGPELKEI